jgi:hypothetical protein
VSTRGSAWRRCYTWLVEPWAACWANSCFVAGTILVIFIASPARWVAVRRRRFGRFWIELFLEQEGDYEYKDEQFPSKIWGDLIWAWMDRTWLLSLEVLLILFYKLYTDPGDSLLELQSECLCPFLICDGSLTSPSFFGLVHFRRPPILWHYFWTPYSPFEVCSSVLSGLKSMHMAPPFSDASRKTAVVFHRSNFHMEQSYSFKRSLKSSQALVS